VGGVDLAPVELFVMTEKRRHGRLLGAAALVAALVAGVAAPAANAKQAAAPCIHRVLIITAMPLELNPLVAAAALDPAATVRVNDRTFYVGRLGRNDVVLTMSGIGLVNATQTATTALESFRCSFSAVLFSGVAGSQHNIGDVTIPKRWTLDDGASWFQTDPRMLKVASGLEHQPLGMSQDVPVGDAACLCPGVDAATPVHMPEPPRLYVGGDGMSYDTFSDHAVPCLPGGGDIAGCAPCITSPGFATNLVAFAEHMPALADPAFVAGFLQPPAATTQDMDAQDEETAAVAKVAERYRVPFLGVRAASDGQGDPLHLPGFPWQFFTYRQLAANNAATVTIAFLDRWASAGRPTRH
jgi:nucleoside phosphorylase